jgi:uroporphyrinogen-III synthase
VSSPRVLNTRPVEQASELSDLLRAAGFDVVEAPAIAIVPVWDVTSLEQARSQLRGGAFAWVVLASQNAGRGLEDELRAQADRVVCGAATAAALGLDHARVLDHFSAAAALKVLRRLVASRQRVLVPRAAEGREELVDGLREIDVEVAAPIAYRTVSSDAAAERLRQGDVDVLTLCSPSAVNSVPALRHEIVVVCLGATTADAARAHGVRVDRVADRPTMPALVAAVDRALGARV